jgi:hypothetical protein
MVHATRTTLLSPRSLIRLASTAHPALPSAAADGHHRLRSSGAGTSALTRHGVPASRRAARSLAAATRTATAALDSAACGPRCCPPEPDGSKQRGFHLDPIQQRTGQPAEIPAACRRAAAADCVRPAGPGHGHGPAARTRVNRAGSTAVIPDLAIVIWPVSSGCRSASSTSRQKSGASSRNKVRFTGVMARTHKPGVVQQQGPILQGLGRV